MVQHVAIYPASHYIVPRDKMQLAIADIEEELAARISGLLALHQIGTGGNGKSSVHTGGGAGK